MAASILTESIRALVCKSKVVLESWSFRVILQDTVDGGGKLTVRSLRQNEIRSLNLPRSKKVSYAPPLTKVQTQANTTAIPGARLGGRMGLSCLPALGSRSYLQHYFHCSGGRGRLQMSLGPTERRPCREGRGISNVHCGRWGSSVLFLLNTTRLFLHPSKEKGE